MSRPGRAAPLRAGFLIAFAASLWSAHAAAAVSGAIVDPFLERFRVGAGLEAADLAPAALAPHGGYPADLLEPCRLDTAWAAAARAYFAGPLPPQGPGLLAWRIVRPGLGTPDAARAWFGQRRDRALELLALAEGPPDTGSARPGSGRDLLFLLAEALQLEATSHWERGDHAKAAALVRELLDRAVALELGSEQILVWSLRLRRLEDLAGEPPAEGIWPELWDLGPFDREGGWALWKAHRRALGAPLLPAGADSARLVLLVRRLRAHGLAPADLEGAGLPPAMAALLAASSLEGEELRRALALWPDPPPQVELHPVWVEARRRPGGGAAAMESLAARSDLDRAQRLDLWRRAADLRLSAGEWDPALADLERGLDLLAGSPSAAGDRLAEQVLRAAALARARGSQELRARTLALAGRLGEAAGGLARDLGEFGLGPAVPGGTADPARQREEAARRDVRQGKAAAVGRAAGEDIAATAARIGEGLWVLWAKWGRGVLAGASPSGAAAEAARRGAYADGLRAAAEAPSPPARFVLACAAAGRALGGSELFDPVGDWLLLDDLARLHPALPPPESPLSALSRRLEAGTEGRLLRHALLGVSLAAGDGRGQIALALGLPAAGELRPEERLRLLYPVPEALAPGLAAAGVEPALVLAIVRNESLFEPGARSRAGALGLMQVMPFHFAERGISGGRPQWRLPRTSLAKGTGILAADAQRFGGDPYRAVAAYNAGPGSVQRWDRQLGGGASRSLFLAWIGYPETRRYTEKVLIDRALYAWILASPGP